MDADEVKKHCQPLDAKLTATTVSPLIAQSNGVSYSFSDRLFVRLKDDSKSEQLFASVGVEAIEKIGEKDYLLRSKGNASEVATVLSQNGDVQFAEVDSIFMGAVSPLLSDQPVRGHDPLFSEQWALKTIEAEEAWNLVQPSRNVTIAIIDVGIDENHPDLNVALSYNSITQNAGQAPEPWEYHGTLCAGIATAISRNSTGIRGVASECRLLAVKAAMQSESDDQWVWSVDSVRRAFEWAWENGADVISCSWEASWGDDIPSEMVNHAIAAARTNGRNGKGCVVVFSVGNSEGPVTYPATLEGVLAVSATNEFDEFKSKTSRDGDVRWGSNFGPEVSVAAPGVKVYTTDMHGDLGVVPKLATGDNDYFKMNGTSAAAPIVAGIAALVLSADGNLSEAEVREIISTTADKISSEAFVDGRNDRVGYGRVNARAAVKEALRRKKQRGSRDL